MSQRPLSSETLTGSQGESSHPKYGQRPSGAGTMHRQNAPRERRRYHWNDMSLNPDDGVGIFAELVGMILFTFLGFTAIQSALSFGKNVAPEVTPTSILIIAAAWGLSYMVAISFIAKVSGGHLNPAVTVSMYACGLIPLPKHSYTLSCKWLAQ
jgi:Major intrinsic protein